MAMVYVIVPGLSRLNLKASHIIVPMRWNPRRGLPVAIATNGWDCCEHGETASFKQVLEYDMYAKKTISD